MQIHTHCLIYEEKQPYMLDKDLHKKFHFCHIIPQNVFFLQMIIERIELF